MINKFGKVVSVHHQYSGNKTSHTKTVFQRHLITGCAKNDSYINIEASVSQYLC